MALFIDKLIELEMNFPPRLTHLLDEVRAKLEILWLTLGSRDGSVVTALASHHSGSGSIPGLNAICGLSLFLVLFSAPRGFSLGTLVFPSDQKATFPNSNSTQILVDE